MATISPTPLRQHAVEWPSHFDDACGLRPDQRVGHGGVEEGTTMVEQASALQCGGVRTTVFIRR
jgi:hypothetical protein